MTATTIPPLRRMYRVLFYWAIAFYHQGCNFQLCKALTLVLMNESIHQLRIGLPKPTTVQHATKTALFSKRVRTLCRKDRLIGFSSFPTSVTTTLFAENKPPASSRQDEIAELEEQLRRLKIEQDTELQQSTSSSNTAVSNETVELERKLEVMKGKDMILSEKELIDVGIFDEEARTGGNKMNDSNQDKNGFLAKVIGVVVGLVVLVGFAQIPIGQEGLVQYSATGSSTTAMKQIDLGDINPDKQQ